MYSEPEKISISDLKAQLPSCEEIAGNSLNKAQERHKYNCPYCGSSDGLHVYPEPERGFHCFVCNQTGDNLDLYIVLTGKTIGDLLQHISELPPPRPTGKKSIAPALPPVPKRELVNLWNTMTMQNSGEPSETFSDYWKSRGINEFTPFFFGCRHYSSELHNVLNNLSLSAKIHLGLITTENAAKFGTSAYIHPAFEVDSGCLIPLWKENILFPVGYRFCKYHKPESGSRYRNPYTNGSKFPLCYTWQNCADGTVKRIIITEGFGDFLTAIEAIKEKNRVDYSVWNTVVLGFAGHVIKPENIILPDLNYSSPDGILFLEHQVQNEEQHQTEIESSFKNRLPGIKYLRIPLSEKSDLNDLLVTKGLPFIVGVFDRGFKQLCEGNNG